MFKIKLFVMLLICASTAGIAQTKNFANDAVSIAYPTSWEFSEKGAPGMVFMIKSERTSEQDIFQENINLMVQDISAYNLDLAAFTKLSEGQIASSIGKAKIISSDTTTKAGLPAQHVIFTGSQSNYDLKFEQFYWVENGKAYIVTFTAEASKFDTYSADVAKMMETFKIK